MSQEFTLSLADKLNRSATSSRSTDGLKLAFKGVLRAVYNHPYIDISPKPSGACMGFCDALASIKKAPLDHQEKPSGVAYPCIQPAFLRFIYWMQGNYPFKKFRVCVSFLKI